MPQKIKKFAAYFLSAHCYFAFKKAGGHMKRTKFTKEQCDSIFLLVLSPSAPTFIKLDLALDLVV